jgi:pimeloyl-ACP methyl ester carboxylesterase
VAFRTDAYRQHRLRASGEFYVASPPERDLFYGACVALHLTPVVEGNEAGETIVFVQGWPDDASLWDGAVAELRRTHRCARVTLPNFGGDKTVRWGYGTMDIVDALEGLVREAGDGRPVTLVMHDWGCYWGHAVHHRCPDLVARIAGVDASPHYRASTVRAVLGIIAYQWWLLAAFVLGGPVGNWMTRMFAKVAKVPVDVARLTAWMNYPYRNIWADMFAGRDRKLLGDYWPRCPVLFVYGENKPFPFHSEAWVDHVRKVGGEVVGLPCGHWVPREPSFIEILRRWLDDHAATKATATSALLNSST